MRALIRYECEEVTLIMDEAEHSATMKAGTYDLESADTQTYYDIPSVPLSNLCVRALVVAEAAVRERAGCVRRFNSFTPRPPPAARRPENPEQLVACRPTRSASSPSSSCTTTRSCLLLLLQALQQYYFY